MFRLRMYAPDVENNQSAHFHSLVCFNEARAFICLQPPVDVSLSNLMKTGGRSPGSLANVMVAVVPPELQTALSLPENATTTGGVVYSAASDCIA